MQNETAHPNPDSPQTAAPPANNGTYAAEHLTNAEVASLSRERLETLLSILPANVAAVLITNRPPQPPHIEYEAHKKLIRALAKARKEIPSVPMDKTVDYVSKRTSERVHYSFASLDSIHKTVTEPLSEQGLVLEFIMNGDVLVALLSHEEGGIHLSWLPLPGTPDIKDLATQITLRRRYLTNQLIGIVGDEDTGERDIPEEGPQRRTPPPHGGTQRRPAAPQGGTQRRPAAPQGGPQRRPAAPAGGQNRPAGQQQQHNRGAQPPNQAAGNEELANRLDSVIAQLPAETGRDLRRRYHDSKELLRHATEELNRRNAAAKPPPAAQAPANSEQADGTGNGQSAETLEKRITDGMRALKLNTDEQADLRRQFHGKPEALLKHITAVWNAQRSETPA